MSRKIRICISGILCFFAVSSVLAVSFGGRTQVGTVSYVEIDEASGIATSRNNRNIIWVANDSGPNAVYAVTPDGTCVGMYYIDGFTMRDWEDIAIGPGPIAGADYLYIGNIGDNGSAYADISVARILEPAVDSGQSFVTDTLYGADVFTLQYSSGAIDSETLMVDPQTKNIHIVTKRDGSSSVVNLHTAAYPQSTSGTTTMTAEGSVNLSYAVGGDIAPSGEQILIKQSWQDDTLFFNTLYPERIYHWARGAGQTIRQALDGTRTQVSYTANSSDQCEAVGWAHHDGGYYTISEGASQPLYYYDNLDVGPYYWLDTEVSGNGTVSLADQWIEGGSNVVVTATPDGGSTFTQWTGDTQGDVNNPVMTLAMDQDRQVTAVFSAAPSTVTLTYTAGANGSISGTTPQTIDYGTDGTAVTAVPDSGYLFVDWSDAGTDNPRTDTSVTADLGVTANFAIQTFTLTYTAGANGSISGTTPQTVDAGTDGTSITAVPDSGGAFIDWSDGRTDNPRIDANVAADVTVTANFTVPTFTLTYTAGANGSIIGTTPQTVDVGTDGTAVTAEPDSGYLFVDWSDASTDNPRIDASVAADVTVTANFAEASSSVPDFALNESTILGTVSSGTIADTYSNDDTYEVLTESESGGKPSNRRSELEHKWTFNVTGGGLVTFYVEAHHTANSEGDDFLFAYSTDDVNYTDMVTVTKTADDNTVQFYSLPGGLSGTVYIRVVDTDRTKGNKSLDNLYVDALFTVSEAASTPPDAATSPGPIDGATSVALSPTLTWDSGALATSHDVYFGTNPTPSTGEFQGNQSGTSFSPGALTESTIYYWVVDEVNGVGTTSGTVWSFTTSAGGVPMPGAASNPDPVGKARDISLNPTLSWTAGSDAASHDVYFGTDSANLVSQGNQTGTTFVPGSLGNKTTYYWRIDEVNATGTTPGATWQFKTIR